MIVYILLRIFYIIPILLIASFVIFVLLRMGGTDPVAQYIIHSNLPPTQELIESLRHEFGLDKPILQQYLIWLKHAITLDFGISFITGRNVSQDFMHFLPNTLVLVGFGFVFMLCFSIPLGILSSLYKDRLPDFAVRFFCFIGVCVPNFWLAFILIIIFSLYLGLLPPLGTDTITSFILPIISIAFMPSCINVRLIRANMLEVKKERHIVYAKLRALDSKTITLKHILCNASLPIITAFGMHIGELIGGSLLIENIFAISGIGLYSLQGIANHDYPIIQCFVVLLCLVFAVFNLIVDLLLFMLDPRLRHEIIKSRPTRIKD